jgi:superfamily II DNA helicase RecQ
MYDTLNRAIAVIVTEAVRTPHFRATERSTVNLLLGRKTAYDKKTIHQAEHYGALAFFDRGRLKGVIRAMLASGFLEVNTVKRARVITVTAKGESYLRDSGEPTVDVLSPSDPVRGPLFYELAMTRRQIAFERMILEDMVCTDAVLEILSKARPTTLEDMESTEGIPLGFSQMYGVRFLKSILEALDPDIIS